MALCLANSLVARRDYVPYDQLVRYKWWHRNGYMSSTGVCFDIGAATRNSITEFERRQSDFAEKYKIPLDQLDCLSDRQLLDAFDVNCSDAGVAGNGALMRLAPVPLFFYKRPIAAVEYSGHSGKITHGDDKAYDACRYYGALIVATLRGEKKEQLLDDQFYSKHEKWFGNKPLHPDIMAIAEGSYKKKGGYKEGIRGKGYIVSALEAALWAFQYDNGSFQKGVLDAVNLGDDTDTTAAIYGQLAGAYYGCKELPGEWVKHMYAKNYIKSLSKWIAYEGERWALKQPATSNIPSVNVEPPPEASSELAYEQEANPGEQLRSEKDRRNTSRTGTNTSALTLAQSSGSSESGRPRGRTHNELSDTLRPGTNNQYESTRANSAGHRRIYTSDNFVTNKDVCNWIRSLGKRYEIYVKIFKENHVDGYWFLNGITDQTLRNYGIHSAEHRQTMIQSIDHIKEHCKVVIQPEPE